MKAIQTRYYGPTDRRGARIKAWAEGAKPLWASYSHEGNEHAKAAEALCLRMGWDGGLLEGGLPNGDRVFVFVTWKGAKLI